MLRYVPPDDGEERFFLEQRSRSVDEGGSRGIPGGAIRAGETPEAAARREMEEEVGTVPPYRKTGGTVQECGGGWRFHIHNPIWRSSRFRYAFWGVDHTPALACRIGVTAGPSSGSNKVAVGGGGVIRSIRHGHRALAGSLVGGDGARHTAPAGDALTGDDGSYRTGWS